MNSLLLFIVFGLVLHKTKPLVWLVTSLRKGGTLNFMLTALSTEWAGKLQPTIQNFTKINHLVNILPNA